MIDLGGIVEEPSPRKNPIVVVKKTLDAKQP